MKSAELARLGIPGGPVRKLALKTVGRAAREGHGRLAIRSSLAELVKHPERFLGDSLYKELAAALQEHHAAQGRYREREKPAP
jgi:hypothetical protein